MMPIHQENLATMLELLPSDSDVHQEHVDHHDSCLEATGSIVSSLKMMLLIPATAISVSSLCVPAFRNVSDLITKGGSPSPGPS